MVKVSGEALAAGSDGVFSDTSIEHISRELLDLHQNGCEVVAMIGGGNIFRGTKSSSWQIDRVEADNVGMLGTIANGILLRAKLNAISDVEVRLMSALPVPQVGEPYIRLRADRHLQKRRIVLLCGGIGEPFVTTDYPAVQRSIELRCNMVLAAKNGVDGIYSADPKLDKSARKYRSLNYDKAIRDGLSFMDQAALVLARQHNVVIHVLDFARKGTAAEIVKGANLGTRLSNLDDVAYY